MYTLETENFYLSLNPKTCPEDFPFPVNTAMDIKVISYNFSARAVIDTDAKRLAAFALRLNELYENLKGSARLEETYGLHSFIEFEAVGRGHITVKGDIYTTAAYQYSQRLCFENEIDQSYLKDFAAALLADFGKYARN